MSLGGCEHIPVPVGTGGGCPAAWLDPALGTSCTTSPQLFLALLHREEQKNELCRCWWRNGSAHPPARIPEKKEPVALISSM